MGFISHKGTKTTKKCPVFWTSLCTSCLCEIKHAEISGGTSLMNILVTEYTTPCCFFGSIQAKLWGRDRIVALLPLFSAD